MASDTELRALIFELAHHHQDPKDLMQAVRKERPKASKKDIVLSALQVMIEMADSDVTISMHLHQLAMNNRAPDH